jgi:hypothetical protein
MLTASGSLALRTTAPPSRRRVEAVDSLAVNRGDVVNDAGSFLYCGRFLMLDDALGNPCLY